uniref:AAA+ ATPase domain-containing protein n=1 Tax=Kwoniella pini CBS 10737 TaxID=1296096 RepID=A0A1B9I4Y6_9TREE|nr:uncharacterized protein I206_03901 [Kwoniella pini CBS 10737]OCF50576.1 hypothetical protein I206_03901 [Kwoniella pini CBS 10737]
MTILTSLKGIYLTAIISSDDEAYDWIQYYMNIQAPIIYDNSIPTSSSLTEAEHQNMYSLKTTLKEIVWPMGKAAPRQIMISTGVGNNRISIPPWMDGAAYESTDSLDENEEMERDVRLNIEPSSGDTRLIKFNGQSIRFVIKPDESRGNVTTHQRKWLIMWTFLGTHDTFTSLTQEARRLYITKISKRTISIFSPDPGNRWYRSASRPMRSWDSIILPHGVKEWLLTDTSEFLAEREYYEQRGVPHRRGYLLYGEPGSGKSSLISALAAKLKLDIYIINLGSRMIDDDSLNSLLRSCPSRCLLLMEDMEPARTEKTNQTRRILSRRTTWLCPISTQDWSTNPGSSVTLSGLLNALDGVASSEGRLLFCTTNWKDKIDPALSRNGRCDVWIEFSHATRAQAKDLFVHFYKNDSNPYNNNQNNIPDLADTNHEVEIKTMAISPNRLSSLAEQFASAIPLNKVSVSALQGYLIRHKRNPVEAVEGVKQWVETGFGQGPTMFLKDGKLEMKDLKPSPNRTSSETISLPNHEVNPKVIDLNALNNSVLRSHDQIGNRPSAQLSKEADFKDLVVNGKGIENIPNGHVVNPNEGLMKRARTHLRVLSRSKMGSAS